MRAAQRAFASAPTIFALATAPGKAGLAVVRVSGTRAHEALRTLARDEGVHAPPRRARLRRLMHPSTGEVLDEAVVLSFAQPRSFTGEDVAELHLHGGPAVVAGVLEALGALPGLRLAEPGEFTRRAFEHGRLDLTQVEALADLVGAETAWQRRQAFQHMKGAAREQLEAWRGRVLNALAYVEADIDFGESEEIDTGVGHAVVAQVTALRDEVRAHLSSRRGEIMRSGIQVAIMGLPNAGKSSLLNRLAGRRAAIVSPLPGTTRDVIEVTLNLGGYPLVVADTAGLRGGSGPDAPADVVEAEGVALARERIATADVRLCVVDGRTVTTGDALVSHPIRPLITPDTVVALTHADLVPADMRAAREALVRATWPATHVWSVANTTGDGIGKLTDGLIADLDRRFHPNAAASPLAAEPALITNARHRQHLTAYADALDSCLAEMRVPDVVLAAEELRSAVRSLGRIVGRVDVEDLLDVIFRDFCIGK